jgi:hypothetical protein
MPHRIMSSSSSRLRIPAALAVVVVGALGGCGKAKPDPIDAKSHVTHTDGGLVADSLADSTLADASPEVSPDARPTDAPADAPPDTPVV